jgi:2-methylaconitate cis-trans-isomerase PrpF
VTLNVHSDNGVIYVERAALLRTARLLMRGDVFVPGRLWENS